MYAVGTGICLQWLLADIEIEEEVEEVVHHSGHIANYREGDAREQPEKESEGAEGEDEQEEEFEIDEDAFFIPLTMAKKLPKEYYKGSDPEWQEFKKVAPDHPRVQKIFNELTTIVATKAIQHRPMATVLGKNSSIQRVWLDIQFPDGPPQDYSRRGLAIGSNYISISEQIIPAHDYNRMNRMLWPSGVVNGLYEFWNTMVIFRWRKVKEALGMDVTTKPGTSEYRMDRMLQLVRAKLKDQPGTQTDPSTSPTKNPDTAAAEAPSRSGTERMDTRPGNKWYLPEKPSPPGDSAEHTVATLSFLHSLAKSSGEKPREPPRGNFIVYGMIALSGSTAAVTFDVMAFYDPKSAKFTSLAIVPKAVKQWRQAPRGGP